MAVRTLKMTIEYDGTEFVGWQFQLNGRSVQDEIQKAFRQITGEKVDVVGAGRTDSGVHAIGQVAHCRITKEIPLPELQHSLNGVLPEDVVLRSIEEAPASFHARQSAIERKYKYFISKSRSAVNRKYQWWVKHKLDIELMKKCALQIHGEHDFGSFCKTQSDVLHHRCIVNSAEWEEGNSQIIFTISADRFLHGMVRALVGTMVNVGRGYTPLEEFSKIMEAKDRTAAGFAAPPQGLFLWEIIYT